MVALITLTPLLARVGITLACSILCLLGRQSPAAVPALCITTAQKMTGYTSACQGRLKN